jgi:CheY-like chemotaxis protein
MPGIDGYDLIRSLRTSGDPYRRSIPAAALTAYARDEDRQRSLESGFDRHLTKPVDFQDLLRAVRELAATRR